MRIDEADCWPFLPAPLTLLVGVRAVVGRGVAQRLWRRTNDYTGPRHSPRLAGVVPWSSAQEVSLTGGA